MSTCDDAEVSERRFGLVARQGIFFLQARKNRRRVEVIFSCTQEKLDGGSKHRKITFSR